MINPLKLKQYLITAIKILIGFELVTAMTEGFAVDDWSRLGFDLVVALVLLVMWGRIQTILREKRNKYREMIETSGETMTVWDALVFSLLWTDQIYGGIPKDRSRLVLTAYTLITIGIIAGFLDIGPGLMPLIISGTLVLAAVNLVAWVVVTERSAVNSLHTELRLARDVQLSLMPKEDPQVEGFDISGRSMPALEVGGDHFTYRSDSLNNDFFTISVFDVSGKGIHAAMSAVFTSGAYAGEASTNGSPAEILTKLNRTVYTNSKRGHFITFLLTSLDTARKQLRFANAGQVRPLLISGGSVQWLEGKGVNFPLGMVGDTVYEDRNVQLVSGDVIALMTDGFTEAMNPSREVFGMERLEAVAKRLDARSNSAGTLIKTITDDVRAHMAGSPQHDDMTMVLIRVL
jgi:serine phosphatase RsbU (regulator of sigma subunit)